MKFFSAFLILANISLLSMIYSYRQQHQKFPPATTWDEEDGTRLTLIHGEEKLTKAPYTLYIFFHGEGKCSCLEDWPNWHDLAIEHEGILDVKGIFNGANKHNFINFGKGFNLPFPLYEDSTNTIHRRFGINSGIVAKVLVGPHGETLFQDSDQTSIRDHRYFVERVNAHILKNT